MNFRSTGVRVLCAGVVVALAACRDGISEPEPIDAGRDAAVTTDARPMDAAPTDPCPAATDCAACSRLAQCGWCNATGVCVAGASGGPTRATCPAGYWRYATCSDPAPDVVTPPTDATAMDGGESCASSVACGACAARSGCGWCQTSNRCLAGSSTGSTDGTCTGATWAWTSGMCASDGGAPPADAPPADSVTPTDTGTSGDAGACVATSCGTCTPMGSCGWCRSTNTCRPGSASGPTDGSCAMADWAWVPSACIASDAGMSGSDVPMVDPCLSNTACSTCASRLGCGWCRDRNRCVTGTTDGPANSECTSAQWSFLPSTCPPPPDPCSGLTTCDACAANSACGWCRNSNQCVAATSSGPAGGVCGAGDFIRDAGACRTAPDPCNVLPTCLVCTAFRGCGYCRGSARCTSGSMAGPTAGSCPSGQWVWSPFVC